MTDEKLKKAKRLQEKIKHLKRFLEQYTPLYNQEMQKAMEREDFNLCYNEGALVIYLTGPSDASDCVNLENELDNDVYKDLYMKIANLIDEKYKKYMAEYSAL